MGGGGGTSGRVAFPEHMESTHQDWLGYASTGVDTAITVDLITAMNTALTALNNPFNDLDYRDPDTDFTAVETEHTAFKGQVTTLDEEADWDSVVTQAVATVDTAGVLDDIDITALAAAAQSNSVAAITDIVAGALAALDDVRLRSAVRQFERRAEKTKARSLRRYSGQMADINSVQSSAFLLGTAMIEAQFQEEVGQFDTGLSLEMYNAGLNAQASIYGQYLSAGLQAEIQNKTARDGMITQGANVMSQYRLNIAQLYQAVADTLAEYKRLRNVADSEYIGNTADINRSHANWPFEVYLQGASVLGSMGGGTPLPKGPTKAASAIGGALSGAAVGAQLGSVVPGLGTAVGAGIGALLGAFAG